MSRKKLNLDYNIYHNTGEKVVKDDKSENNMDLAGKKVQEMQISGDINEFFTMFVLDELETEVEISLGIEQISELGRQYRYIHIELKTSMGSDIHANAYKDYEIACENIRKFVKNSKSKIKLLKKQEKEKEEERMEDVRKTQEGKIELERKEAESKACKSLKIEVQVYQEKLTREIDELDLSEREEIKNSCDRFKLLLDEYYKLLSLAKIGFGVTFDEEWGELFKNMYSQINEQIKLGKSKLKELNSIEEETTKVKIENKKIEHDSFIKEQKFHAENVLKEIEMRSTSLQNKCNISELKSMSDLEVLEKNKNLSSIDIEMREILDRVTGFSKIAVLCGNEKEEMLKKPNKIRDIALKSRNEYARELHSIVTERDISEEKLKNSSGLIIELEKFKGHGSKLDVYSFKTEFEKLIQPNILKRYWVDMLKNNYLTGSALVLVEKCDKIEEIWEKLVKSYGNVRLLLQNKIALLDKFESLDKIKGDEKLGNAIAKIINMMMELSNLAEKHNLEYKLYVGGGLEKVFSLIGEKRERKFVGETVNHKVSDSDGKRSELDDKEVFAEKLEWQKLMKYLQKELDLREKLTLLKKSKNCLGVNSSNKFPPKNMEKSPPYGASAHSSCVSPLLCHICGADDHVPSVDQYGTHYVDYFSCKKFVSMSPKERRSELMKKKLCFQCLAPGMKYDEKHTCYTKYCCPDSYHSKFPKGMHVLVCEAHKKTPCNIKLLEDFKKNIISKRSKNFESFTKNISLMCCNENEIVHSTFWANNINALPDVKESPIFMFQTIKVGDVKLNIFFDLGCFDMVIRKSAIDKLTEVGRARQEVPGPVIMSGVGNKKSTSDHGIFSICLPLKNGRDAILSGICLDTVTHDFPEYTLTEVENDIRNQCKKEGGESLLKKIPKLPSRAGGGTDILFGIQYSMYQPKKVWESLTGLFVSDSAFLGADESTGVLGGPHPIFTKIEREHRENKFANNPAFSSNLTTFSYYTDLVSQLRSSYSIRTQLTFQNIEPEPINVCDLGGKYVSNPQYCEKHASVSRKAPKCIKVFDEIDTAGTEATFRCIDCRNCDKCKKSRRVDHISFQEEIEQDLINRNVEVDIKKGRTTCKLPFVTDPDSKLDSDYFKIALKVYQSQIRSLAGEDKLEDKMSVIKSEGKLQELNFVAYFNDLPDEDKKLILKQMKYFIAWRAVFNPNSKSTPCRLVFDASLSPNGKCALNNLLAKGTNNMNNLVMIIIRWLTYLFVFHTDISKMYNTIWLDKVHWRFQMYLWEPNLSLNVPPVWKVILTAIYGFRSSGNIAECGLRKTAELTKEQYPKAYDVIMNDIYVDDCMSGVNSSDIFEIIDQLTVAVAKGGFKLKPRTLSGEEPPEELADEGGEYILVAGLKWFSKEDLISIKVPELNFGKKVRGKKSKNTEGIIPDNLTKRNCVSRVYEMHDPLGKVIPITSGLKLDLNELTLRKLDWDDKIPENLRQIWKSNFEMIEEIGNIRYKRAVVPEDAVDFNMETIDTADASQTMICVAIYVRFRRKSGGHSCQLIFSRSKVVPKDMTMPRAELLAASMNASTGHVVKTALGDRHVRCWKLTDSEVALHWINCIRSKLKMWVRNQVIDVKRLSSLDDWRHVDSANMIADLGTRKGATVADVGPESTWINGLDWMSCDEAEFPVRTITEIVLGWECLREVNKESVMIDVVNHFRSQSVSNITYAPTYVPNEVGNRYSFSEYVIDPNRFRFRKVVRVLALCLMFIENLRKRVGNENIKVTKCEYSDVPKQLMRQWGKYLVTTGNNDVMACKGGLVINVSENMISAALQYYFRKASDEIKHFLPSSRYKNISEEKDGVLYYIGRILPNQEINGDLSLCDVSLDLTKSTFCVPLVDSMSPIAYSIADEIHWYHQDVKHAGVESMLRQINCIAHIINGRKLVKSMKEACAFCRILEKRGVKAAMGPAHESHLCIAPAFHNTQVDICGPFDSYSNSNKRAKLKIWFVVFCCATTGAVDCKVMEDYSSDSFVLAFIRFSCRYGYPCNLYPDYGSQLLKGCKDMNLAFADIKQKLSVEFGINFEPCPVGAHYVHGKVERKIQSIKKSIQKECFNARRSIIQWETLAQQISNSINNMPIGLGNKTKCLENLEILTPNRLLLGRNNNRCPTSPLTLSRDVKKIIESNANIFNIWFKSWLVSYVPSLIPRPKWFENDRAISIGDIVLFSKSEKEFEDLYQYGIIKTVYPGKDGLIRKIEVEYQNYGENTKRTTTRGVRDVVIIHPIEELGISKELYELSKIRIPDVCMCQKITVFGE